MTLPDQIALCERMIARNRDYTVKDFLEAVRDIDGDSPVRFVVQVKKAPAEVIRAPRVTYRNR